MKRLLWLLADYTVGAIIRRLDAITAWAHQDDDDA